MRPALYWVIRFEDGSYEAMKSVPFARLGKTDRRGAERWHDLEMAKRYAANYRDSGHPCRIIRVVRKETAK